MTPFRIPSYKVIVGATALSISALCLVSCSGDSASSDPFPKEVTLKDGRIVQCVAVMDNGIDCDFANAKR